jgi:hypothetical protein
MPEIYCILEKAILILTYKETCIELLDYIKLQNVYIKYSLKI